MKAEKLCELSYREAIEIIKNEQIVFVPWYIAGGFNKKLKFTGDFYDPEPTEKVIKKIEGSSYGANVWRVGGKYIVKIINNMW